MCPSRASRKRIFGFQTLTYTLPHVADSHPKGFKAEKLFCPKRHERPRTMEVATPHPSACLAAAGMRTYQDEEAEKEQAESKQNENDTPPSKKKKKQDGPLSEAEVDALLSMVA